MNNNRQIVAAYEAGAGVEEIAENLQYEHEAVRLVLQTESSLYRRQIRNEEIQDVSKAETLEMAEVIKSIARTQKDAAPGVALKAAIYIHNEGKGRNNIKAMVGGGLNVAIINQRLAGMKAAKARVYGEESAVVDV